MMRKAIRKAFQTGYLSAELEEQIRQLFNSGCGLEDIDALIDLQYAVMAGQVKRESGSLTQNCLVG